MIDRQKGRGILIIVGSGRSGTVYLSEVLKRVYGFGFTSEPKFVYSWYKKYFHKIDYSNNEEIRKALQRVYDGRFFEKQRTRKKLTTSFKDLLEFAKPEVINNYEDFIEGIFSYIASIRGHKYPCYKDPYDVANIGEISKILPNAKIIHIVRDGRDVVNSLLTMPWGPTNAYSGAKFWMDQTSSASSVGKELSDNFLEIRYEDLINQPEKTAHEIDLFQQKITGISKQRQLVTFLLENSNTKGLSRWKNELDDDSLLVVERVAGKQLEYYGYSVSGGAKTTVRIPLRILYSIEDIIGRLVNIVFHQKERIERLKRETKRLGK